MNWFRVTCLAAATTLLACAPGKHPATPEDDGGGDSIRNEAQLVQCTPLEQSDGDNTVLTTVMGAGVAGDGKYYVVASGDGASAKIYRPDQLYIGDAAAVAGHSIGGSTVGGNFAAGTFALTFAEGGMLYALLGEWRQGVVVSMWLSEDPAATPATRSGNEEMLELLSQDDAASLPAFGLAEVYNVRFDALDRRGVRVIVLQRSGVVSEDSYRVFTTGDQGSLDEREITSQLFDSSHTINFVENGANREIRYGKRVTELDGVAVKETQPEPIGEATFRCFED